MSGRTSGGGEGERNTAESGFEEDVGEVPGVAAGGECRRWRFSVAIFPSSDPSFSLFFSVVISSEKPLV